MSEESHSVLPESALSEGEFLERQAQQAQAAIARALANAKAADARRDSAPTGTTFGERREP